MINIHAFAKINIGLKITGRLPNGYHTLYSLFQEIDLHDNLSISLLEEDKIDFTTSGIPIPGSGLNLCVKAAELLKKRYNIITGVKIHLAKNIPIGAGLGGGSSDGAATLKALTQLWELKISDEEMIKICTKLGADIPFFIHGGLQLAENIGDKLTPQDGEILSGYYILLVKPEYDISTPWAYEQIKRYLIIPENISNFAPLETPVKWQLFENDFERVIESTYPEVSKIKHRLIESGSVFASLSGSGSTVYGIFDNQKEAERVQSSFAAHPYWTCISRPVTNTS
jgi:4-diphosphocytidyl-2-C-methyl-D-erythritol kinase